MVKDPVCGMMLDPKNAGGQSEYKGRTYYFCSSGCKRAFDREPERYIGESGPSGHQHGSVAG